MAKILVANKDFDHVPFKNEAELEKVVVENFTKIFEENSYYFDLKKEYVIKKEIYLLYLMDIS